MIINTKNFKYKTTFESNLDLDLRRHEGHCERVHAFCKRKKLKEVDRIKRIKRTSELGKNTENRQNCLPDLN
jgi:hypothetical protein